jgi:hypothetical protein
LIACAKLSVAEIPVDVEPMRVARDEQQSARSIRNREFLRFEEVTRPRARRGGSKNVAFARSGGERTLCLIALEQNGWERRCRDQGGGGINLWKGGNSRWTRRSRGRSCTPAFFSAACRLLP